jgi:hypothetical protein
MNPCKRVTVTEVLEVLVDFHLQGGPASSSETLVNHLPNYTLTPQNTIFIMEKFHNMACKINVSPRHCITFTSKLFSKKCEWW